MLLYIIQVIYGVSRYKDNYYYYINTQQDANTKVMDTANFLNRKSIIFLGLPLQEEYFLFAFFFYNPPFWRNKMGCRGGHLDILHMVAGRLGVGTTLQESGCLYSDSDVFHYYEG
jgi:hypothetical protein